MYTFVAGMWPHKKGQENFWAGSTSAQADESPDSSLAAKKAYREILYVVGLKINQCKFNSIKYNEVIV